MPLPADAALFEASLGPTQRHALGAHYTSESDIFKIVGPTIIKPFDDELRSARTREDLEQIHARLSSFHVLDPACGAGNFLYVAYRALLDLEARLLARLQEFSALAPPRENATRRDVAPSMATSAASSLAPPRGDATRRDPPAPPRCEHPRPPLISPRVTLAQLHGIDIDPRAAELARTTLRHARPAHDTSDANITVADALLTPWPAVSAIIGNPPFLDARKLTRARPDLDITALRRAFPHVPGRADLCVYFFNKAHDHLRPGQRAGLVGTNTIRQNYSREGGLDYILANDGTITSAVSSQLWPGAAAVHVSIVNWIKGPHPGPFTLTERTVTRTVARISSALSSTTDVSSARPLASSQRPFCFEGIQPGHRGFRLTAAEHRQLSSQDPRIRDIVSPYMNGDDLLSARAPEYLIDFTDKPLEEAATYPPLLAHLERTVLPDWRRNADRERLTTGKPTGEHQNRLHTWWQLKRPRLELQRTIKALPRYIACSRVSKRPIFAFLDSTIKPDSSLVVFAAADDYSFGILASTLHWRWFQARSSTLRGDYRYTSNTVFDTFPWPRSPSLKIIKAVATAAVDLRTTRDLLIKTNGWTLRTLYKNLESTPTLPLHAAQRALDAAVRAAYGIREAEDPLAALLARNHALADLEASAASVTAPGLPYETQAAFITGDRITAPT